MIDKFVPLVLAACLCCSTAGIVCAGPTSRLTNNAAVRVFKSAADGSWLIRKSHLRNDPADANDHGYGCSAALSADGTLQVIGGALRDRA